MHAQFSELTDSITQSAAALRQGYDVDTLHALRVSARRVRSLLKHARGKRARRFRRAWGAFVRVTNRARDWDVFLQKAAELLSPADFEQFRHDHEEVVEKSHRAVLAMVHSRHWREHLDDWHALLKRARVLSRPRRAVSLPDAIAKARTALAVALNEGDESSWHRFRIAVKEVRYIADSNPAGGASEPAISELVAACKALQTLLGDWHDSVVQAHALAALAPTPQHAELLRAIRRDRDHQLAEILAAVTDQPLFPAA